MNNDKIGELYDRRIGTPSSQQAARRRVHWMAERVRGDRVLDLGCSQGVASLLVARGGRAVVGVDREPGAIEAARERLRAESEAIQARVEFLVAEASDLPFGRRSFDTVLLGEVLEHQVLPDEMLAAADRVLKPGGTLIVTVPYGLFRYHDHKEPIYLGPLVDMLGRRATVVEVELIDRYLALRAVAGRSKSVRILRRALEVADGRVRALDADVDALRREAKQLQAQADELQTARRRIAELSSEGQAARARAAAAISEAQSLGYANRKLQSELDMTRLELIRAEAERDEALRVAHGEVLQHSA